MSTMFVIQSTETGKFLALPEGKHYGSLADIAPWAHCWEELDHAARFHDAHAALRQAMRTGKYVRVLSMTDAWKVVEPAIRLGA